MKHQRPGAARDHELHRRRQKVRRVRVRVRERKTLLDHRVQHVDRHAHGRRRRRDPDQGWHRPFQHRRPQVRMRVDPHQEHEE